MIEILPKYQEQLRQLSRKRKQPEPEDDNFEYIYERSCSCTLKFDGASKGNPGPAGAGAVLRSRDGNKICMLRENVGIATNNVAEYRALILGMKHALKEGFKEIHVRGDSELVCNQVKGLYRVVNKDLAKLCGEAKELKAEFPRFHISHVPRELNTGADRQANLALSLKDGEVEIDCKNDQKYKLPNYLRRHMRAGYF